MTERTVVTRVIVVALLGLLTVPLWWPRGPGEQRERATVPVPEASIPRPIRGDPAMAHQRRQPDAVVAGELVVPWSTIRTLVAKSPDDGDRVLVEELSDVLESLRRTRRAPARAVSLDDTLAILTRLEATLNASGWSDQPAIRASLQHHTDVLERFDRR